MTCRTADAANVDLPYLLNLSTTPFPIDQKNNNNVFSTLGNAGPMEMAAAEAMVGEEEAVVATAGAGAAMVVVAAIEGIVVAVAAMAVTVEVAMAVTVEVAMAVTVVVAMAVTVVVAMGVIAVVVVAAVATVAGEGETPEEGVMTGVGVGDGAALLGVCPGASSSLTAHCVMIHEQKTDAGRVPSDG